MKRIFEIILAVYAKLAIKIHKPQIIGITGSVGKTSTKDAVALVLRSKFEVRATPSNLNSQLGLPLAILGFEKAGGFKKNLFTIGKWIWILISGFVRIFVPSPKILVLEMGVDKPGDISYLLGITGKLKVAVVTDIGISHMEFFSNPDSLAREKLSLLKGLEKSGVAVLNADNPKVLAGKDQIKNYLITYGFGGAIVQASDYQVTNKNNQTGIGFKVSYQGNRVPFFIPNTLGKPTAYAALAATSVGLGLGLNLVDISLALEQYATPAGRMKILTGVNNSILIDDTYNAAPSSTIAALEALSQVQATRRVAVIGHMAELGVQSEAGHREVGGKIVESGANLVYLVGEKTKVIEEELRARHFSGRVYWYPDSETAKAYVKKDILPGDVVLVKGSQSARMEKIVKEILADPKKAPKLLVRQGSDWQ